MKTLFLALLFGAPALLNAADVQHVPAPDVVLDRTHPIPPGPEHPFIFPTPRRDRLQNGIAVTATKMGSLPLIAVTIAMPAAAAASSPPGMEGIRGLTVSLLNEGTTLRDGNALARAFEKLGASFDVDAAEDATTVTIFAMKDSIGAALGLASETMLKPAFRAQDVDRLKMESLSNLKQKNTDPNYVSTRRLSARVFGSDPYGATTTPASLAALTPAALKAYHAEAYSPVGASIHFTGDVSIEEAKALAQKSFGAWKAPSTSAARAIAQVPKPDVRPTADTSRAIDLIDMPNSDQSFIQIGQTALARLDPDYYAFLVMNTILGGGSGKRLYNNLRERHQWTYGAESSVEPMKRGGELSLVAPVRADKTADSVHEMLSEMRRMREEDVDELELANAKKTLLKVSAYEDIQDIADMRASAEVQGLGDDVINAKRAAIAAVTVADVRRVAQKYLRPDEAAIVIAGNAAKIREALEALAKDEHRSVRVLGSDGRELHPNAG